MADRCRLPCWSKGREGQSTCTSLLLPTKPPWLEPGFLLDRMRSYFDNHPISQSLFNFFICLKICGFSFYFNLMSVLSAPTSVQHLCLVPMEVRRNHPLELESQMVVSCHVGAGT